MIKLLYKLDIKMILIINAKLRQLN